MVRMYPPVITRLRVLPDAEDKARATVNVRAQGARSPHPNAKVATVRRLIEQTVLSYSEIARKTGVGRASICRWTRDGGWQRPVFAPRATDTVPLERASAHLKRRTLAARLSTLAERAIREQEERDTVDLDKLAGALELMKLAKLAAKARQRRHKRGAEDAQLFDATPRELLRGLRAVGIDTLLAPENALWDFVHSRAPLPKNLTHRQRREKRSRERE